MHFLLHMFGKCMTSSKMAESGCKKDYKICLQVDHVTA